MLVWCLWPTVVSTGIWSTASARYNITVSACGVLASSSAQVLSYIAHLDVATMHRLSQLLALSCSGCQSPNESHALSSRPQRSSWTSAGLHYWLTAASHRHFIAVLVASRESWISHGQTEESQIEHSPLLHHGRGTNCRLILKWQLTSAFRRQWRLFFSIALTAPNNAYVLMTP